MKKKTSIFVISIIIIVIPLFLLIKYNDGAKTIEEAINSSDPGRADLIHEEKIDKGSIIFYN